MQAIGASAEGGEQTQGRGALQGGGPAVAFGARKRGGAAFNRRHQHQDISVGNTLKQAEGGQKPAGRRIDMCEGILDAGTQGVGAAFQPEFRRQRALAGEARQQVLGRTGFQMRQDQLHAQRMAVEPFHQPLIGLWVLRRARAARRIACEHLACIFCGVLPRKVAKLDAAQGTEPVLRRAAGDQHSGLASGASHLLQEGADLLPSFLIKRWCRTVLLHHAVDGLEVVPNQKHRIRAQSLNDSRTQFLWCRLCQNLCAEDATGNLAQHAVQAKACQPRLKGMEEHPARLTDTARIAPPPRKALGEFGLARAPGALDQDDAVGPRRSLKRVELTAPPHKQVRSRGKIIRMGGISSRRATSSSDLLEQGTEVGARFGLGGKRWEPQLGPLVVDRHDPVLQRKVALGARSARRAPHLQPARGRGFLNALALEQGIIKGRHELGSRHRIDAVAHRHHRPHTLFQQPRGHRCTSGCTVSAKRSRLTGIQDHQRQPRPLHHLRKITRRNPVVPVPICGLKNKIACPQARIRFEHASSACPLRIDAVPVKMERMIGRAVGLRRLQRLLQR
mmetsp:Transcript_22283/g.35477  ORF Transcript_22283/g.35477 Transcript_22283/m.35477 type:complete len:562 (-) Transcript_22283:1131-2816(-)